MSYYVHPEDRDPSMEWPPHMDGRRGAARTEREPSEHKVDLGTISARSRCDLGAISVRSRAARTEREPSEDEVDLR